MQDPVRLNLPVEWKAFSNAQFGRNFTFKTRQIYKRAEEIFFSVLPDILPDYKEQKGCVTEHDVHRLLVKQIAGVTKRRFPKLSATSINIYLRVWNTFLNSLYKDDLILKRPKIARLMEHKKERVVLTDDHIQSLVTTKIGPKDGLNMYRVHVACLTSLGTGARLNEVLMLRAEDLNFSQNLLNIYSGKGRKQRVVPMSPALAKTLYRWVAWRNVPENNFIFGSKVSRSPTAKLKNPAPKYLYKKMSGSNVVRDLAILCERLGIKRFKFHELRHTFATRYLQNGGNPAKLRQLMGHSSILTTMIYEHLNKDSVYEKFSDYTPY
jgi:integrase